MKKSPRFLLCQNPLVDEANLFILSTRSPKALFEVIQGSHGKFDLILRDVYEGSESDVQAALQQAHKWYIALLAAQSDLVKN